MVVGKHAFTCMFCVLIYFALYVDAMRRKFPDATKNEIGDGMDSWLPGALDLEQGRKIRP